MRARPIPVGGVALRRITPVFGPSSWVWGGQYARVVPRSAPSFAWTGRSPVAQLAERSAVNRRVGGSSPPGGAGQAAPAFRLLLPHQSLSRHAHHPARDGDLGRLGVVVGPTKAERQRGGARGVARGPQRRIDPRRCRLPSAPVLGQPCKVVVDQHLLDKPRCHGIASAIAICPSKPSVLAMSR